MTKLPTISIIAAIGQNHELGVHNKLPWSLPRDTAFFKSMIASRPMIMGRKTALSPDMELSGIQNLIISRDPQFKLNGFQSHTKIETAIQSLQPHYPEVLIGGGAQIYAAALPITQRLYLTHVHGNFSKADAFFPPLNLHQWHKSKSEFFPADEQHSHAMEFAIYDRI
ncbi:dihydrofolate reductase [Persicobacter sp. CCB-QB2]|uniref:dihydrofolate reductase n=1 Tax=Persicobacter sp. CCB-QB2 TaxID=1561025 RepID=UPI0006A95A1E|nr:dihydrofolate reductase [Persicobacter sp. CCB-QB2]